VFCICVKTQAGIMAKIQYEEGGPMNTITNIHHLHAPVYDCGACVFYLQYFSMGMYIIQIHSYAIIAEGIMHIHEWSLSGTLI
jgi:hypothetical protein